MLQWRVEALAPGRDPQMDPELVRRMVPCSLGTCSKKVLLALECEWCGSKFCSDHASASEHNCKGHTECPYCQSGIAVGTGDVAAAVTRHVAEGACPAVAGRTHCPVPRCKQRLNAINDFTCPNCSVRVCLAHRHPEGHDCASRQKEKRADTAQAQRKQLGRTSSLLRRPTAVFARPAAAAAAAPAARPVAVSTTLQRPPAHQAAAIPAARQRPAATSTASRPAQAPVPASSQTVMAPAQPQPASRIPANTSSGAAAALESGKKLADQGKRQMAQMDFDGAAITFQAAAAALGDRPHNVACMVLREESLLGLARCKLTLTLYQDCLDACKLVLASTSDPERQNRACCASGQALFATREYTAAVRQLEQAAAAPEPSIREAASTALHEARLALCGSSSLATEATLSQHPAAAADAAEALASARKLMKRGRAQRVAADFGGAADSYAIAATTLEEFTDVADAKEAWEESLLNLAQCQLRLAKHQECAELCTQLLRSTTKPEWRGAARYACGQALQATGQYVAAVQQLHLAVGTIRQPLRKNVVACIFEVLLALRCSCDPAGALAAGKAAQLVEEGKRCMQRRDRRGAAAAFRAAAEGLEAHHGNTSCQALWEESLLELAQCHLDSIHYEECINACTRLLDTTGNQDVRGTAHYLCGQALLASDDYATAVCQLQQAAGIAPEPSRSSAAAALERAQQALLQSAPVAPSLAALATAQPLVQRGSQQVDRGNLEAAAAAYRDAAGTLAGHLGDAACRDLWEESMLGLSQCQLGMQEYDACVDTCMEFMGAAGDSPSVFCVQYNCGCALLALGDFAGAVHQLELAAAAAVEPMLAPAQEALQEAQQALQVSLASQEELPLLGAQPQAVAAVPPAVCLRCRRGRLDGALMHGTTLHICVCWTCACELAQQRKPCPKCHLHIDQIARVG